MPSSANRSRSSSRSTCPVRSTWSKYRSPTRFTVYSGPAQTSGRPDKSAPLGRDPVHPTVATHSGQRVEQAERLPNHLVHVVVLVRSQPSDEVDSRGNLGERLVLPVPLAIL